jgi:hypothetical protein
VVDASKHECLNRVIPRGERHFQRTVSECVVASSSPLQPHDAGRNTERRRVTALVLARRALGRRLRRAAQRVLLAAAVLALFVGPGAAAAAAQTTLAEVKSLRCTFTRQTTGSWAKGDAPETAVRPSSLVLRFESIDAESGTARLRNGAMATDVTVRLAEGYLHLMQAFRTGPLYITTVFAAGATARGFKAAHSRHELFTTPLPGATSSPEQYYGTCEAGR